MRLELRSTKLVVDVDVWECPAVVSPLNRQKVVPVSVNIVYWRSAHHEPSVPTVTVQGRQEYGYQDSVRVLMADPGAWPDWLCRIVAQNRPVWHSGA